MAAERRPDGPTSYDSIPYEGFPYGQTHPDRLATVARLFGMKAAPPERCTVLELGCAAGDNLIPMASELPGSRFLGLDLSSRQIEDGRRTIGALGVGNVELLHRSILDVDDDLGRFDYVICHGVYSWVPPEGQARILSICDRNLAPGGVAYVSYNTLPGWHLRGMVRDMLRYHSARFDEPGERIRQSRALLEFLSSSAPTEGSFGPLLREEADLLRDRRDSYLFHEFLEESNEALYFHEFVERAAAAGLQFLGEADTAAMASSAFPEEVRAELSNLAPDIVHAEQYLDFLRDRGFRQTLLCHPDVALERTIDPSVLEDLHVASPLRPAPEDEPGSEGFIGPGNRSLTTTDPLAAAAFRRLGEAWPAWVPFPQLVDDARGAAGREGSDRAEDASGLGARLLALFMSTGFLELHAMPPHFVLEPGERPAAAPLARHHAESTMWVP